MQRVLVLAFLVAGLCLVGASGQSSVDPYLQGQRQKAAHIAIGREGVTRKQAELLAEVYFFSEVNGCGGPDAPVKRGRDWIVPVRVGYAGALAGALRIHGSTGAVSYAGHPTRLPKDFAKPLRY
jgi:hypothetical protein